MNDSIIVLGGTGFIGSALIRKLVSSGFKNVASVGIENIDTTAGVTGIKANILDYDQLKKICEPYNTIINCTGQITNPIGSCLKQNSIGITNIINVVKNYKKKLIHLSTVSVYGTADKVTEESDLNPETPYSTCKSFAEFLLKKEIEEKHLFILRLSNIYGINSSGIFGYFLRSLKSDKKLIFNNNGDLFRFFMHVDDCASNIVELIKLKEVCGIFNLIGQEGYTIKQLIKKIEIIVDKKFFVEYDNKEPYENINEISMDKLKKLFQPNFKLTIDNYIKNNFII